MAVFLDDGKLDTHPDGSNIIVRRSYPDTTTPVRLELVLTSWLLVLLRTQEHRVVSFEWTYEGSYGNHEGPVFVLSVDDETCGLQKTVQELVSSLLHRIRDSSAAKGCMDYTRDVVLSSRTLKSSSEQTTDNWHVHVHILPHLLDLCAIWHSTAVLPFTMVTCMDIVADLVGLCALHPTWTLQQLSMPLQRDLDIIWGWNASLPATYDTCIHEIIRGQSNRLRDKVAISSWDGDLTYSQVEQFSTHAAHVLQNLGVRRHDTVPLCFEKSRWAVVAVLAVMKAGATMVMTDPSIPLVRLKNMAQQVDAKIIISSRSQVGLSKSVLPDGKSVIVGSEMFHDMSANREDHTLDTVLPSTLMYIIFTSGSTGTPKGVKISHRTYTSSAFPRAKAVGYSESSRVLDFASYAFDVSIDSMLLTLANGGTLCIPSDDERINDINGTIKRMRVNYAGVTPSVARILEPNVIKQLTNGLGLGGEAVSASDVKRWGRNARIIIGYGPCECTIGCTINSSAATGRDYISIGTGNGAAIWIVDPTDHNKLLPLGAVGELLVEGPIVGQGYLNDPEKTSQAFIEDPTWLVSGHGSHTGRRQRLYKTGDLGSYDPDGSGSIVFAGRKDTQVKLRGQRVELGEIECQLNQNLPSDSTAIAEIVKPTASGGQPTLVAFVAFNMTQSRDSTCLKLLSPSNETRANFTKADKALAEVLPRYMLPAAYISVNTIPVLVSGKTDRKHLRELGETINLQSLDQTFDLNATTELTEHERVLSGAWSQVLNVNRETIRPDDNFFSLGGDSIAAMKLASLCRSVNLQLSVASITIHPTLSSMADSVRKDHTAAHYTAQPFSMISGSIDKTCTEASEACGVFKSAVEDIYPCTPTQESLLTFSLKSEEPYIAQRVARIPSGISLDTWMFAWEATIEAHPILRTRVVQLADPGFQQVVLKHSIAWKHSTNLSTYLLDDRRHHMTLGDPLARYAIVHDQKNGHWYMVRTVHHVLYDGWSESLLLQKVHALIRGQSIVANTTMKDYVAFVHNTDDTDTKAFWEEELSGAIGPQFPRLPSRDYYARPTGLVERTVVLKSLAGLPFTMATLIRAAWALVASKHTGNKDVVFGETIAGRDLSLAGVEGIIGPLIATVPVRVHANQYVSVKAYLQSIQRSTSSRAPYQHFGMQNIRKVSEDAQVACETGTGIVIQPEQDDQGDDLGFSKGDTVQEALHFNPYPLMLAFGLQTKGFKVCANYDTTLIEAAEMSRILAQIEVTCERLIESLSAKLGDIVCLADSELNQIWEKSHLRNLPAKLSQGASCTSRSSLAFSKQPRGWICDPRIPSQLSPIGCVGELWLEGEGIPADTTNSPAWLLAGSSSVPGRRTKLHRTGDLVRMQSDGSITFVRRKGAHVSIQGRHVDVGELEAFLSEKLEIGGQCVVAIRTSKAPRGEQQESPILFLLNEEDKDMIDYGSDLHVDGLEHFDNAPQLSTMVSQGLARSLSKLERAIRDSLPSYMVPLTYIVMDSMPKVSGEFDRAYMEDLVAKMTDEDLSRIMDRWKCVWKAFSSTNDINQAECILRSAWAETLEMAEEDIQAEDNFFRLGGDSVLAMKLVSSLRTKGHSLRVLDVFQHMRLGDAAKKLVIGQTTKSKMLPYVPFTALGSNNIEELLTKVIRPGLKDPSWRVQDAGPTTATQALDVMNTVNPPRTALQYTTIYLPRSISSRRVIRASQELVRVHPILRTIFIKGPTALFQVALDSLPDLVHSLHTSQELETYVTSLCFSDISSSFDYGSPFTKFFHVTHDPSGAHCLVLRLSHAQYDGVSLPLMLRDLSTLYAGGQIPSSLPLLSYISLSQDYSLQTASLTYWASLLSSSKPTCLPTSSSSVFHSLPISAAFPGKITAATIFCTGWALTLARHLGVHETVFGLVSSGRSLEGSASIRGPTYNYIPVRVDVGSYQTSAEDLLSCVQDQIAASTEHDHVPFQSIAERMCWENEALGSLVHVQDIDLTVDQELGFGGVKAKLDVCNPGGEPIGLVKAVSFRRGQTRIVGVVGEEGVAERLLSQFAESVEVLCQNEVGRP